MKRTPILILMFVATGLLAAASMEIPANVDITGDLRISGANHIQVDGFSENKCISNALANTLFADDNCDDTLDPEDRDLFVDDATVTQVFNGKTIHYSNNIVTVTSIIPLTPAACQNATAYLQWDHETANYPAATCVAGTNTAKAYADFDQTTDECLQASIPLPDDFVPADGVDGTYTWLTTATSGSAAWCSQIVCTGDGETNDPSFPAQASGNCVSDTAKGTTNQINYVTDSGLTITGCSASEIMHIRTCRDPNETGGQTDTLAADARLANMYLKIRREM